MVKLRHWLYLAREQDSYEKSFAIWKFRLRTHFKNSQKKLHTPIPEVLANKAIYGNRKNDNCDNQTIAKKGIMTQSVVNFLPNYQNGKNKTMMDAQKSRLNTQSHLTDGRQDDFFMPLVFYKFNLEHKNSVMINCLENSLLCHLQGMPIILCLKQVRKPLSLWWKYEVITLVKIWTHNSKLFLRYQILRVKRPGQSLGQEKQNLNF